jgi:hypothetical protein
MHPLNRSLRALALVSGVAVWAGCSDSDGPVASTTAPDAAPLQLSALNCTASVRSGTVTCVDAAAPSGASRDIIVGGQNRYVRLASSNLVVDAATGSFDFDATVQNLIPQKMGTTDGTTLAASGVRVFFGRGPATTAGTGSVRVANAQMATFIGTEPQPYFQYDEILAPNQTSGAKRWELEFDAGVESFTFGLYVSAPVQFPVGWVELEPNGMMDVGTTHQLAPAVRTAVGDVVPGATVTFASSDTTVLTVDAAGLVSGVRPGNSTVTATSVSGDTTRTGQVTISVCAAPAVGETVDMSPALAASVCVSAGASAGEYTLMPVNQSQAAADTLSLLGTGIAPIPAVTPNLMPDAGAVLGLAAAPATIRRNEEFDIRLREWERRELTPLLRNPAARVKRPDQRGGARYSITPGVPAVGDLWSLNVASGCAGAPDNRAARVVSVGRHVIIVADTLNPAGGFTTAQYDSIALEFDTLAYPVDTLNFRSPTDLDTNQRVVAFYTRSVNELSPPNSSSVVTGYFTSRDLFDPNPTGTCPRSNAGEIFYMLVPDPTGAVNGNTRTVSSVRNGTVATMGHELQHLINASRRIYFNNASSYEEVWMNEGLSHIAEELMFYRASGLSPRGNIRLSDINTGATASRRIAAFNTYASQNFSRLRPWLARPDTSGPFKTNDVLATRGAVWAFLRYAADRRNGDDAELWRALVNSPIAGLANLQSVLGAGNALPWQRDFIAAMYADDFVTGVNSRHTVSSWNFRSVYSGLGGFPLGTRALTNGTALTLAYSRGGGTAYTRFSVPANTRGVLTLSGPRNTALRPTAAAMLLRTR